MRNVRLILLAGLAASLFGCQSPGRNAPGDELPSSSPTATSTDLAGHG